MGVPIEHCMFVCVFVYKCLCVCLCVFLFDVQWCVNGCAIVKMCVSVSCVCVCVCARSYLGMFVCYSA